MQTINIGKERKAIGAPETDPLSLHLDQTTPQTVINGLPNFEQGIRFLETSTPAPIVDSFSMYAIDFHGKTTLRIINGDNETFQVCRDNLLIVRNTSGDDIPAGKVVYITGSTGNVPNIALAKADSEATMPAIGVTIETIIQNNYGRIMLTGKFTTDTSLLSLGDVFVSDTDAGELTNIQSVYPSCRQRIASVLVVGVGNGSLEIDVRNCLDTNYYDDVYLKLDCSNGPLTTNDLTIEENLIVQKHAAFGVDASISASRVINIAETVGSDIDFAGVYVDVEATVAQTHPNWLYAMKFRTSYSGDGISEKAVGVYGVTRMLGIGTLNKAVGFEGAVRHDSAGLIVAAMGNQASIVVANEGDITDAYGFRTYFNLQSTGNIETAYGYYAGPPDVTGDGKITDYYGFYVKNTNKADNNYGFYQQGANLINVFENGLRLNTSLSLLESGADPTYYTILQSGDLTGANSTYTLPTGYPAVSGYVLSSTTEGVMSWVAAGGVESDPIFSAWISGPPNVSEFTNDAGYLTSIAGEDHSTLANLDYASAGHTGFEPTLTAGLITDYYRGDKSWANLNTAIAALGYLTSESDTLDSVYTRGRTIVMDLDEIIFDVNNMTNSILGFDIDIPGGSGVATMDDKMKWDENVVILNGDNYTGIGWDINYDIDFSDINQPLKSGSWAKTWLDLDVVESLGPGPGGMASGTFNLFDISFTPAIGSTSLWGGNWISFKYRGSPVLSVALTTGNTYIAGSLEVDGASQFDAIAIFNSSATFNATIQPKLLTTTTSTSTSLTFSSTHYGQIVLWSPTGTATGTLPANGATAGSWFDVILLTNQTITISAATADTLITVNDTNADSVAFSTANLKIGSHVRFISNGSVWIAINIGSTTMTVAT